MKNPLNSLIFSVMAMLTIVLSADPLAELDKLNVVWTSPSTNSAGSMPLGNGEIGVNVWVENNGDLLLLLGRTDTWSGNGRLLKLGRVRVRLDPNPFRSGQFFVQELNLQAGEILITAGSGNNRTELKIWVDAHAPVVEIEADGLIDRTWRVDLEMWRTTRRLLSGGEEQSAYGIFRGPDPVYEEPDTIVNDPDEALTWYHRNEVSIWGKTLEVQSLKHWQADHDDPLLHRTFGATIFGTGLVKESTKRLVSPAKTKVLRASIVTHTAITDTADEWLVGLHGTAAMIQSRDMADRHAHHLAWWEEFWLRHWLLVTSAASPDDARAVSRGYALQRFMQACAGRGAYPIKFNGSLFTVDALSSWDSDYRRWGPCYWWQNTRLPYFSMPVAGDFDLMEPLFAMYMDALPLARERVETYYGHPGAYFPETIYFWGTYNNDNYGWDRTGRVLGRADNAYIRWEWQGGIELVWLMLERYRTRPESAFLTNILLPMADDIIALYDWRFPRDATGEIRFEPAQALETYAEGTINPAPEIGGLMALLSGLLELPAEQTPAENRAIWTRLLSELPPLPLRVMSGSPALAPAEVLGPDQNSESPELYAVFPYALFQVGKPDLELADWTFETRVKRWPNGWGQDPIFGAMLGRTSYARDEVLRRFKTYNLQCRFPAMWGPNSDWTPDQCHGAVNMIALQKMILQQDQSRIHLFPAWPIEWSLRFRLYANGGTMIEGELQDGQIVDFNIVPLERYDDVETHLGRLPPKPTPWQHWLRNTQGHGGRMDTDPDGDGYPDLLEYALGGDPAAPASPSGVRLYWTEPGLLSLVYSRPAGRSDVQVTLEQRGMANATDWITVPVNTTTSTLNGDVETISLSVQADSTAVFRLSARLP